MKILQVHNHYRQPGGEDTVVRQEAELLRSAGHEVIEYRVENPLGALNAAASMAVAPWNPWAAHHLRLFAERYGPDVVHVHNTWFSLSPSVLGALRKAGAPVVMTLHNYRLMCSNGLLFREGHPCELCVGTHPWHGLRYRCYRGSAVASGVAAVTIALHGALRTWERDVDLFLALTEFSRNRFIAGGVPQEKIHVKPNFVWDPGERTKPASESRTILYVGRLSLEKGIQVLLDAWGALAEHELKLIVVGDGPLLGELRQRASESVSFLGPQPAEHVQKLMLEARALVLPSVCYEGQPMVLVEALACGLPVIASAVGALPEVLSDSGAARMPAPGDSRAWSAELTELMADTWIDDASRRARRLYEQRHAPKTALRELETAYALALDP